MNKYFFSYAGVDRPLATLMDDLGRQLCGWLRSLPGGALAP